MSNKICCFLFISILEVRYTRCFRLISVATAASTITNRRSWWYVLASHLALSFSTALPTAFSFYFLWYSLEKSTVFSIFLLFTHLHILKNLYDFIRTSRQIPNHFNNFLFRLMIVATSKPISYKLKQISFFFYFKTSQIVHWLLRYVQKKFQIAWI